MSSPPPSDHPEFLEHQASALHDILVNRYGKRPGYTGEELLSVFRIEGIPSSFQPYAIALFAQPEISDGFLQRIGSTKSARELRAILAAQSPYFFLPGEDFPTEESMQPTRHVDRIPEDSIDADYGDDGDGAEE